MADELNKPGSVRDGMVTFRIPLDQAAQLKELAAELDTPVSALMQRAVKELIAKRGHFDPEQIKLQEVEVNTFGAVYRVTDQILYPLFDRISKHVEVLEYIGQMLSVLKVQAKDLLEDKE